jgi:hypothetical protein
MIEDLTSVIRTHIVDGKWFEVNDLNHSATDNPVWFVLLTYKQIIQSNMQFTLNKEKYESEICLLITSHMLNVKGFVQTCSERLPIRVADVSNITYLLSNFAKSD